MAQEFKNNIHFIPLLPFWLCQTACVTTFFYKLLRTPTVKHTTELTHRTLHILNKVFDIKYLIFNFHLHIFWFTLGWFVVFCLLVFCFFFFCCYLRFAFTSKIAQGKLRVTCTNSIFQDTNNIKSLSFTKEILFFFLHTSNTLSSKIKWIKSCHYFNYNTWFLCSKAQIASILKWIAKLPITFRRLMFNPKLHLAKLSCVTWDCLFTLI